MQPEEPEVFRADRPFIFLIQHKESGAILFVGRVMDPH
jgi:serpin B